MAFPDVPAISAVSAVPVAAALVAISTQRDGEQGRARQYARTARASKPVADAAASADTSHISVEGLEAELQALLADIRVLTAVERGDSMHASRLVALATQSETVKAEIAEASRRGA